MRLNRYLAQGGHCSRRRADELILAGQVSINGQVVAELGVQVKVGVDEVRAEGHPVHPQERQVVLLLNKPKGVITTAKDTHGRRTVLDLVQLDQRVVPVGRLDQDSSGALLLTNDGELMHLLLHPSGHVPKEYILLLDRDLSPEEITRLSSGVKLDGRRTKSCELERIGRPGSRPRYRMVLTEGRNRQIRRMLAGIGVTVERLHRRSIAGISVEELEPGEWRLLLRKEVDRLKKAVRLSAEGQGEAHAAETAGPTPAPRRAAPRRAGKSSTLKTRTRRA